MIKAKVCTILLSHISRFLRVQFLIVFLSKYSNYSSSLSLFKRFYKRIKGITAIQDLATSYFYIVCKLENNIHRKWKIVELLVFSWFLEVFNLFNISIHIGIATRLVLFSKLYAYYLSRKSINKFVFIKHHKNR